VEGPAGALVGVFLDDEVPFDRTPPLTLDFTGAAREMPVIAPLLRQVFYVGRGRTGGGTTKSFVIPPGATRLFLGVLDAGGCNSDNSGSFALTAVVADVPPSPPPGQVTVFAVADIALAGQPNGTLLNSGCRHDSAVLNAPVEAALTLVPGQVVQFTSVTGTVAAYASSGIGPDGDARWPLSTASAFGLSSVEGPAGALVGVFLDDEVPSGGTPPPDLDFSTAAARDLVELSPSLRRNSKIGVTQAEAGGGRVDSK
jgi:hypothetical protein